MGHQREVDGELVAAGDEFLGAVERIDQKETFLEGQPRLAGALLGKRGNIGCQPRQALGDDAVGGEVGSVTGDPSLLPSTVMEVRLTARMASPAAITRSVSDSSSAAAASPSRANGLASFMSGAHLLQRSHLLFVLFNRDRPVLAACGRAVYQTSTHA